VIIKGWFTRSNKLSQVEPWSVVLVGVADDFAETISQGGPRKSTLWAPLVRGRNELRFEGSADDDPMRFLLLHRKAIEIGSDTEIHYIAVKPPQQNAFARRPRISAPWIHTVLRP
jgi:hypothetical protein